MKRLMQIATFSNLRPNSLSCAAVLACLTIAVLPATSIAVPVVFSNTPNDPVGQVLTTNSNDGWSSGRGMRFDMIANQTISSFGVLQDVTNTTLNYEIFDVTNNVVLAAGSTGNVSTTGLAFIDVFFASINLLAGNTYHMEFDFLGISNQNFFHREGAAPVYNEGAFGNINGTLGGPNGTGNTVIAQFRVGTTAVPEPGTLALLGLGLAGMGLARRRKKV